MKMCSVEGCEKKVLARGWCHTHYHRWKSTGSVELRPKATFVPDPCGVEDCAQAQYSQQVCRFHYDRLRRRGTVEDPAVKEVAYCAEPDCSGVQHSRGLCQAHYRRFLRNGTTENRRRIPPMDEARFLDLVVEDLDSGCWVWEGSTDKDGYGRFYEPKTAEFPPRVLVAYRWAYEHWLGPIPAGATIDHLCHVRGECLETTQCPHRRCVCPDHLEVKTARDNILRGNGLAANNALKTTCVHGHAFTPENTYVHTDSAGYAHRRCRTCLVLRQREYVARQRLAEVAAADED